MSTSAKLKELSKIIFSIVLTALFYHYDFTFETGDINAIASALASSSGSILGFLITAIALMTALMDKSLLANLRATGGYSVLIRGSFACAAFNFALLVSSICLLLPWNNDKYWLLIVTILMASLAATYLLFAGYAFFNVIMATSRK